MFMVTFYRYSVTPVKDGTMSGAREKELDLLCITQRIVLKYDRKGQNIAFFFKNADKL